MAIERQAMIDFGAALERQKRLQPVQENLNKALGEAKTSAKLYLNDLLPAMLGIVARMDRYYNFQLAITREIKADPDRDRIVNYLRAVEDQTVAFKQEADDVSRRLDALRRSLSAQSADFTRERQTLAAIVEADDGLIKELDRQMAKIDGDMSGLIAGAVISGLAVVGGAVLIAIGSIAGFVTAGTSAPLAVLGGVILVGGIGGSVGTGVGLGALAKQKSGLMLEKTSLTEEVKFSRALQSTLDQLTNSTDAAALASQDMANAWTLLGGHMKNLADDLAAGRLGLDALVRLYVAAADRDAQDVKGDLRVIQQQLAGVNPTIVPQASLSEVVDIAIKRAAPPVRLAA